jgi:hypothetical protein
LNGAFRASEPIYRFRHLQFATSAHLADVGAAFLLNLFHFSGHVSALALLYRRHADVAIHIVFTFPQDAIGVR